MRRLILYPFWGGLKQQWKLTRTSNSGVAFLIADIPWVLAFVWMASSQGDQQRLHYMLFAASFMVMWNTCVFRVGWIMNSELFERAIDFTLLSKTPLFLNLLSKAAAVLLSAFVSGVIGFLLAIVVFQSVPQVTNVGLLLVSVLVVFLSVLAVSSVFAPLIVLMAGHAGFFGAVMPAGVALSGFVAPPTAWPDSIEWIPHLLPTAWGMKAVAGTIASEPSGTVTLYWGVAIALSMLYALGTVALVTVVEKRVRITGSLGRL